MDPTFRIHLSGLQELYSLSDPCQQSGVIRSPLNNQFDFRMVVYSRLAVLTALAHYSTAQFVPAPTDLTTKKGHAGIDVRYKEVPPGICEQDPNVKSYSGYADVGENEHIFW